MTDQEKVIKGLEICSGGHYDCRCPYDEIDYGCEDKLMQDALALLKEQDTVEHACKILRANGWKEDLRPTEMSVTDCISRQAAIRAVCERECTELEPCKGECEAIWAIKELPSVQPERQEPKLVIDDEDGNAYCPHCSTEETREMNLCQLHIGTSFCPYCGKKVEWNG